MNRARRNFLALAGLSSLGLGLSFNARAQEELSTSTGQCYDPVGLPLSQRNRRLSVSYVETSEDAYRRCGLCAYFTAAQGNCGACQILGGGVVNAGAVCLSFAQRSA